MVHLSLSTIAGTYGDFAEASIHAGLHSLHGGGCCSPGRRRGRLRPLLHQPAPATESSRRPNQLSEPRMEVRRCPASLVSHSLGLISHPPIISHRLFYKTNGDFLIQGNMKIYLQWTEVTFDKCLRMWIWTLFFSLSYAEQLVLYMKIAELLSSSIQTAIDGIKQGKLYPSTTVKQGPLKIFSSHHQRLLILTSSPSCRYWDPLM